MLTNIAIQKLIVQKKIIENYDKNRLQPASYDMVIGTIFRNGHIINNEHKKSDEPIIIAPGEVVTMLTLETLHLPNNIAATAYAMNAQSSEGLLVLNPGHVDPGYNGPLTIVALNLRKVSLPLQLGEKIFTVVFEQLDVDCKPAYQSPSSTWKRLDFERNTNKKVVEKSIESLAQLLSISEKDINTIVRNHWMSWVVMGSSIIGMIAAVIAAIFAVFAVLPNLTPKPSDLQKSISAPAGVNVPASSKSEVLPKTKDKSNN